MARGKTKHSKPPSQRQLRVGELVRESLIDSLVRSNIRDPLLTETSITISEVRMTPDLKQARIFVMPLGGGEENTVSIVEALRRAAPFLRREVAQRVKLRYAPSLLFEADISFDTSNRMNELLNKIIVSDDNG